MDMQLLIIMMLIPFISALIGWGTNYLAIKSLFRPVKRKNFLGFKFQGVIPKRKLKISNNISDIFEQYLFNGDDIFKELNKSSNLKNIKKKLLPIIEDKITEKIPEMFKSMAKPIIHKILENELENILKKIIEEAGTSVIESINVRQIVYDKLSNYDISNLEKIVYKIASKEFKHIEFLGAVIGFLVGLFQVFIMLFSLL